MNQEQELQELYDNYKIMESYINIDWNKGLVGLREHAKNCFAFLFYLSKMIEYRQEERAKKTIKKDIRINHKALDKIISEKISHDILDAAYSEISGNRLLMRKIYEDLRNPHYFISYPSDLRHDLKVYMAHAIALFKSFESLINRDQKYPLVKVTRHLQETLHLFYASVKKTKDNFIAEERLSDRGSKIQKKSNQREQKLDAIKLHPRYSDFIEAMEKYIKTGKGKDQRVLNTLFTEITGITHSQTRKNYRDTLIQEYIESQKLQ